MKQAGSIKQEKIIIHNKVLYLKKKGWELSDILDKYKRFLSGQKGND